MAGDGKVTKAKAMYQSRPQDGEQCSGCEMFLPPKGCSAVTGDVSPSGWCSLFEKTTAPETPDDAAAAAGGPRLGNVIS